MNFQHSQEQIGATGEARKPARGAKAETFIREERKVGRNEPCPCGSGKKQAMLRSALMPAEIC